MTIARLCVSVRFLVPTFHGRRDRGEPEWPPSPLRLFQALVATAGRLEVDGFTASTRSALRWLEEQPAPLIVAPPATKTNGLRLSVPNNAMDVVAGAWSRGNDSEKGDADPRTHRTMKTVRPMWLRGDRVSFLWILGEDAIAYAGHVEELTRVARRVAALGWGVDLVVGDASVLNERQASDLEGELWMPFDAQSGDGLRVPVPGTLQQLEERHVAFLHRIGVDGFTAPPPLTRYSLRSYRRETDPQPWPFSVYSLREMDRDRFRSFDPVAKALTVAGMMRHATKVAAESAGWEPTKIARFVLGHGEGGKGKHEPAGPRRFAYVPLPSIEPRGGSGRVVGRIRRVMLMTFDTDTAFEMSWARQSLTANELVDENTGSAVALLSLEPPGDNVACHYTRSSAAWVTVTPVALPGFDDPDHLRRKAKGKGMAAEQKRKLYERLTDRVDGLVRKAIRQSGFTDELAANAVIDWRKVGFIAGVDHADRYGVPDHIRRFPRYHVRIEFRDKHGGPLHIQGPICIGSGRFYGLGLFVAE